MYTMLGARQAIAAPTSSAAHASMKRLRPRSSRPTAAALDEPGLSRASGVAVENLPATMSKSSLLAFPPIPSLGEKSATRLRAGEDRM